jgi:hypothetical protein
MIPPHILPTPLLRYHEEKENSGSTPGAPQRPNFGLEKGRNWKLQERNNRQQKQRRGKDFQVFKLEKSLRRTVSTYPDLLCATSMSKVTNSAGRNPPRSTLFETFFGPDFLSGEIHKKG